MAEAINGFHDSRGRTGPIEASTASTALMAEFITFRLALLIYWLNILLMGVGLYLTWRYTRAAGLAKPDVSDATARSIRRRIGIAQSLCAFGALHCLFGTGWSLGFIVLVQLNDVFAPRLGFLWRL
jgi:uncharacterized membrane protein